jgi:7-carboxy-7-deazaguanine synthase
MRVTEVFQSIQGEGTRAGRPCAFVRFTGCDLRCTWCDSAYAFHGGVERSRASILEELNAMRLRHVCLTGSAASCSRPAGRSRWRRTASATPRGCRPGW